MQEIEVFKFGGVAVGNAEAIRTAVAHVRAAKSRLVVIVSAMNGITDLLLEAAQSALRGDRVRAATRHRRIDDRHAALVDELFGRTTRAAPRPSTNRPTSCAR